MKYSLQLRSLLALLPVGLGCADSIRANTIFTDLNSPYSNASDLILSGSQSGGFVAQAMQSTAAQTGVVADAQLFMGLFSGNNNPMVVAIESNSGSLPGSILATLTQQGTVPHSLRKGWSRLPAEGHARYSQPAPLAGGRGDGQQRQLLGSIAYPSKQCSWKSSCQL